MNNDNNPYGNIYISHRAIASIAYQSVIESYGVVGLAPKNLARGLANAIVKDPTLGVNVNYNGETIIIDLYLIIEYGTRITSVAKSVSERIKYRVEKSLGVPVENVNIHVRGLRVSDYD